jgi:hypothetical protein
MFEGFGESYFSTISRYGSAWQGHAYRISRGSVVLLGAVYVPTTRANHRSQT